MASSTVAPNRIDTLITKANTGGFNLAVDADCDGVVDFIGHQYAGRSNIDSFKRPSEAFRLVDRTTELDSALKRGMIPYSQIRVCQ